MTREEIIQALRNCRANEAETRQLLREREVKLAKLYGLGRSPSDFSAPRTDGTARGRQGTEALIDAVAELDAQLAGLIRETTARRMAAEEMLDSMPDATQRLILRLYYINRMPMWMVGRELDYSKETCWRMHNRAIRILEER